MSTLLLWLVFGLFIEVFELVECDIVARFELREGFQEAALLVGEDFARLVDECHLKTSAAALDNLRNASLAERRLVFAEKFVELREALGCRDNVDSKYNC